MDYIELSVPVADDTQAEIVTAMLSDLPFEAFDGQSGHLSAYIPADLYDEACRRAATEALAAVGVTDFDENRIARSNWNADWESDFTPVEIGGRHPVRIRATHHEPAPEGVTDIVVAPHMSFGTGHHATTSMMVRLVAEMGVGGQRGLDMGCGTGILSIAAAKFGAESMTAVDIDSWACDSCRESAALNGVADRIETLCGSIGEVAGRRFDFILANIGRNIVVDMMPSFASMLDAGGRCIMSGFFVDDAAAVEAAAAEAGLERELIEECDGWAVVACRRTRGERRE